jgi:arginyl-tRNA synthetase
MERFAAQAAELLTKALKRPVTANELEVPPDRTLGDFAFPCFKLAKEFRKGPPQLADQLARDVAALGPSDLQVRNVGPYVNFTVPSNLALSALLKDILAGEGLGRYGSLAAKSRGRWVIEYSSPNVAKPFQIYHLRPTALGAALARIGLYRGFDVISINHLGDWGTQYGKLAVAFRMYGKDLPKDPSIDDLVGIYVKFHTAAEQDPKLEDEAREAFLRLEKDDAEMIGLWKRCVEISMKEFYRIYKRLGVEFTHIWGESHYKSLLGPLLAQLRKSGFLVESEGAWVVPVTDTEGRELPPCILEKKDGATIYATRDVAAAVYRHDKFNFDRMSYIVGGEQKLHFQQVFAVLRKMGHDWVSRCEHIPTGLYRFKDAKMSTRKGNFVTLEDALKLATERVTELVQKRDSVSNMKPAELAAMSESIAVGAVIFHDLHSDPARDVEFDLERVVDFEGETGPYLQYAHTRCLSILRKAARKTITFDERLIPKLVAAEELTLVKTLGIFPLHLERTLSTAKASALAHYLIDVTKAFGAFYRECQVLTEDADLTSARLMLVEATRRVLAQGLGMLGVPLPDRM